MESAGGTPNRQALTRGSLGTMAVRGGSFLLSFVATLLLARYLGVHEFGIYSEALAWSSVVAVLGTLGLDRFAVREVAAHAATDSWSAMHGLVRYLPRFALGFCALAAVGATIILLLFRDLDESSQLITFVIAIVMAPVMSLSIIRQGMLQGLGRVVISCLPEDIIRPGIFIVVLVVVFGAAGTNPASDMAMAFQAVALFISFLIGTALLKKYLPGDVADSSAKPLTLPYIRSALPIGVYAMVNILLMQAGIVLLGLTSEPNQVALFATTFKIAIAVGLAEYAVNNAYQPMVSSKLTLGDLSGVERLAPRAAAAAFGLALPLALFVMIFAGPLLSLFGPGFESGATTLRILCASFAINPLVGQNGALLTMSQNVRPLVGGTAFALVFNVVLNLILSPEFGAEGAALAWFITLISWNMMLGVQVRKIMGFWTSPLILLNRKRETR